MEIRALHSEMVATMKDLRSALPGTCILRTLKHHAASKELLKMPFVNKDQFEQVIRHLSR